MRILNINSSDTGGGAAIASIRLHDSMKRAGIDSKMLVINKNTTRSDVIKYPTNKLFKLFKRIFNRGFVEYYNFFAAWSWNHFGFDLSDSEEVEKADIIIIHWINDYSISLKCIEKILKKGKPVYWFMHDMWPITGGCHHSFECSKFKDHCGKCIMMHNRKGSKKFKDISFRQFNEKLDVYQSYRNLKFITPSKWLYNKVKESRLGQNHEVFVHRNVLDTEIFKPRNKNISRQKLGLPLKEKLILFGADNINSPYKGWSYLKDALNGIGNKATCIVYGNSNTSSYSDINMHVIDLGKIRDEDKLIDIYSACDVFVTPSLADNYPNVLIEAMACGLICVGFNTGGIPEIIENGKNGLVVEQKDSFALQKAILKILNSNNYEELSRNAVGSINKNNNFNLIIPISISNFITSNI